MREPSSVGELLEELGRIVPWSKAADWDPVGLQLGDPSQPARRVAVCHEVAEGVVGAAESQEIDLLITYHPLLFRATRRLVAGRSPEGRAWRLARAGVAVAVAHTAFDVAPRGAADALAGAIGLEEVSGFGRLDPAESVKVVTFVPEPAVEAVAEAMAAAGAGVIGGYTSCSFRVEGRGTFFAPEEASPAAGKRGRLNREPEVRLEMVAPKERVGAVVAALVSAHPYEEPAYDVYPRGGEGGMVGRVGRPPVGSTLGRMAETVGERLGRAAPRMAGDPACPIERVAVVPGSGAELIEEAAAAGADLLVTGDVSHHRAVAALDLGLAVIDPGHARTERPGVAGLYASVADLVPGAVDLTDLDWDPWR